THTLTSLWCLLLICNFHSAFQSPAPEPSDQQIIPPTLTSGFNTTSFWNSLVDRPNSSAMHRIFSDQCDNL
ncbi:hypothetical protein FB451DRAFT_1299341, partial [Mycena latifolia]